MPNTDVCWPIARVADLVEQLARAGGLATSAPLRDPGERSAPLEAADLDGELERLTRMMHIEADATDVGYEDVDATLSTATPAIFVVKAPDEPRLLGAVEATRRHVTMIGPSGRRVRMRRADAVRMLKASHGVAASADLDRRLQKAGLSDPLRHAAAGAILDARLAATTVARCWSLRSGSDASYWQQLREARLPGRLVSFALAYVGAVLASIGAWWVIGAATFEGRLDAGATLAWTFLLLTLVPFALLAGWSQGVFMVGASGLLKLRLLTGALRLTPDETRRDGVGRHLARVIESGSLEALALSGGFATLGALFDLTVAGIIFVAAGDWTTLLAALVAIAGLVATGSVYVQRRAMWTDTRVSLTQELVERMVGHRTRLVQETHISRHSGEDASLESYAERSGRMDRWGLVMSVIPRLWLFGGVVALGPRVADGTTPMPALAVSLGGVLLVYGALAKLSGGFAALVDAGISWTQVRPLLQTLRRQEPVGDPDAATPTDPAAVPTGQPLVAARDLSFSFAGRKDPVISKCSFQIAAGDRIHLSGTSGGGKSTLVSLLTGVRTPSSGVLLVDGLDRETMGAAVWRRRVAAAPQFHDNYIFNDSLAFNLLLGRRWPPTPQDLRDAEEMCHLLQLGELVDRMPAGLQQVVGENGWQLSHGEKSRVFMARALLQGADVVVLDESFAELDPESLRHCLPAAASVSRTFLVVAHA
jgi:ATP-binding cassette subfamily B protein